MNINIKSISAFVAILAFLGSIYVYVDSRYALAEELQAAAARLESRIIVVASRLDFKIVDDQRKAVQRDIWAIEDQYRNKSMPPNDIDKLRKLEVQQKELDTTHDAMIKESIKR